MEHHDIPSDLQYFPDVQYLQLLFDANRKADGVSLLSPHVLMQTVTSQSHKVVFPTQGLRYNTGLYFFHFLVLHGGPNNCVSFGVGDEHCSTTTSCFPGYCSMKGVSYYGHNGCKYWCNTDAGFGPAFEKGTRIGMLLNTNHRTLTFYHNNTCVGTAAGPDILTGDVFYPIVSTYDLGATIVSLPCAPPKASAHAVVL